MPFVFDNNAKIDVGPLREERNQIVRMSSMFKSAPRNYHYRLEMKTDLEKPGFEKYSPKLNVIMHTPFEFKISTSQRNTNLANLSPHVSSLKPDLIDKRLRNESYLQKLENIDYLEKNFKLDKYLPSAQALLKENLSKIENK